MTLSARRRLVVFLMLAVTLSAGAQSGAGNPADAEAGADQAGRTESEQGRDIGVREVMINAFLPGYAQIRMGRVKEGAVYLASVPLQVAGIALQTHYLGKVLSDPELQTFATDANGRWYVYYLEGLNLRPDKWEFALGTVLGLYGTLLSTHSQYDLLARLAPERVIPLTLGESMLAPWQPRNLLNREILPVFALSVLPDLARLTRSQVTDFFARERVRFLGREVAPAAGLALAAGSAVVIAQANAVWEEIAYRGLRLRTSGVTRSSISFGLVHLPNALVPNASVQDTLWQALFATMFGLHAAVVTERDGGDFRKAVAWHFWNNVLAFTLGYLSSPDDQMFFSVGVDLRSGP